MVKTTVNVLTKDIKVIDTVYFIAFYKIFANTQKFKFLGYFKLQGRLIIDLVTIYPKCFRTIHKLRAHQEKGE